MRRRPRHRIRAILLSALLLAGCETDPAGTSAPGTPGGPTPSAASTGAAPASVPAPSGTPSPAATGFTSSISPVSAADLGASWHPGCPVGPDQLRLVRVGYRGFDGRPYLGAVVVDRSVAADVVSVFAALYRARFPIRRMTPIAAYGGSDDDSMAADNTSGFNCRDAVSAGPAKWSAHAYGKAIDVNPVENPYLVDGRVLPPAGASYADRDRYRDRPGLAVRGGTLVEAFASVGWQWGGGWRSPDYQHFTATGG
ncbi:M15 family metallopeptidase [Micromonospora sp. NPDC049559]|uniref:M15 family metallopeptidase n=1 Tax=Micromonospora sp. NPDC049559 TaxID=3155923 RepID=UPI0034261C22